MIRCFALFFPFFYHDALEGVEEDGEDEDMFEAEFRQYKRTYYMTKMGVEVVSEWVTFTVLLQGVLLKHNARLAIKKEKMIYVHIMANVIL